MRTDKTGAVSTGEGGQLLGIKQSEKETKTLI